MKDFTEGKMRRGANKAREEERRKYQCGDAENGTELKQHRWGFTI